MQCCPRSQPLVGMMQQHCRQHGVGVSRCHRWSESRCDNQAVASCVCVACCVGDCVCACVRVCVRGKHENQLLLHTYVHIHA